MEKKKKNESRQGCRNSTCAYIKTTVGFRTPGAMAIILYAPFSLTGKGRTAAAAAAAGGRGKMIDKTRRHSRYYAMSQSSR